jgi:hypothetical protein
LTQNIGDYHTYRVVPTKKHYTFTPTEVPWLNYPGNYSEGVFPKKWYSRTVINCDFATATRPRLVFETQPNNPLTDPLITPPIRVKLCESDGTTLITDDPQPVTVQLQEYLGMWQTCAFAAGTAQKTTVNGVATFDDLSVSRSQTYRLKAVASHVTGATSATFQVRLPYQYSQISGRVTAGSATGPGLGNVTITATAPGQPSRSVMTAADGTYTLTLLPPATYTVKARRQWYGISPSYQTVTVPPSQTAVDFVNVAIVAGAGDKWIDITAPNGGEAWTVGEPADIFWNTFGLTQGSGLKVELSRDGGNTYELLFADTPNDSSEAWTVTGPPTEHARVRITSLQDTDDETGDYVSDVSNAEFTILAGVDSTPPDITPPADVTAEQTGPDGTAVALGTPVVTDDADPSPVVTNDAPAVFPLGMTVVTWTATDASANEATATQIVTVVDTIAPELTAPADVTAEQTSADGTAVALGAATATDLCDADLTITNDAPAVFPLGETLVTWTATDASGNVATATQKVTVVDTTPPTLSVPGNITGVEQTCAGGTYVDFAATATDLCDAAAVVVCDPPSGTEFPLGTTTVTVTATDASGNAATGTFTVTVVDTTAPSISSVTASPNQLWPANHKLISVAVSAQLTDICDAAPTWRITGVTCNQPVNGSGDGNTQPDWQITGDHAVKLRAERSGKTGDRVYTIAIEALDASGNKATASCTVTVPHDQGGGGKR